MLIQKGNKETGSLPCDVVIYLNWVIGEVRMLQCEVAML